MASLRASAAASGQDTLLLHLIDLNHRARAAQSPHELAFLLVNETRALAPYRQAALWFADGGVRSLSGVVQVEANVPYTQWLNRLCRSLTQDIPPFQPVAVSPEQVPADVAAEWSEWLPPHVVWIPFPAGTEADLAGGLLLAADNAIDEAVFPLLGEWLHGWHHAWRARFKPAAWSWRHLRQRWQAWGTWWQWRKLTLAAALLAVLFFPVQLTILAPGELTPAHPAVIRAPLDGVIGQFYVQPNEQVKAGQLLFSFDDAPISSRLDVARQALATAQTEYRQSTQMALHDNPAKNQMPVLLGKINEKQAEAEYLESQFKRSHVVAPQAGIAIFDDPAEWIGRPVQTGERVMKIATAHDVEIEAWIPVGDAIPLPEHAEVSLYLTAMPLSSLSGKLRYLGHEAVPRPDGSYAYRLRAQLSGNPDVRVGLKGTAKIHGESVPLIYWIMRRPVAMIRQLLAI